jgi:hypothetical protein
MRRNVLFILTGALLSGAVSSVAYAAELTAMRSSAACKDTSTVEQFEKFERVDDDQGYKRLYIQKGASGDCIFLNRGEILTAGETNGRWICVKESESSPCYWAAASAVKAR